MICFSVHAILDPLRMAHDAGWPFRSGWRLNGHPARGRGDEPLVPQFAAAVIVPIHAYVEVVAIQSYDR